MGFRPRNYSFVLCMVMIVGGCGSQHLKAPLAISIEVSPQSAAVLAGQTVQLTAAVTDTSSGAAAATTGVTWSASAGSVDQNGNFTAPSQVQTTTVFVTATSTKDQSKFGRALIHVIAAGQVAGTANPQVASYAIVPGAPAKVTVNFGLDTTYGLSTWALPSGVSGPVNFLVAGMKANTAYHMAAVVAFDDGTRFVDADHVFTTGAVEPAAEMPAITVNTTVGKTPQSGVEAFDLLGGVSRPTVTDINGNVLWAYTAAPNGPVAFPIKLLANGHFLLNFDVGSALDGNQSDMREVDLAGNLIWEMTAADLNKALAGAACAGCNITVVGTHHDFVELPNGHLIVIASNPARRIRNHGDRGRVD